MSEGRLTILLAVTHLLGVGHLSRMAALGRGLVEAGHRVVLVSGGRPAPTIPLGGLELVQLPPVHCIGVDFRTLLDDTGERASEAMMASRVAHLMSAFRGTRPDAVVVELFPFGRRQLATEFSALVEEVRAAVPRPALLVSIRDILNPPSTPGRAEEALERLGAFDRVMVHGDPKVAPLDASWPVNPVLATRLAYTGYIAEGLEAEAADDGRGDILVSGGGSPASLPLFRAALGAAAIDPGGRRWRILVGHGVPENEFEKLRAAAPPSAVVERARSDFRSLLAAAACSASQAGYNTIVDVLRARVPAVIVPFEAGDEKEQRWRAERFAARGLAAVVTEGELSPRSLLYAVSDRLAAGDSSLGEVPALDGVARSVAVIEKEASAARRRHSLRARITAALDRQAAAGTRFPFWWRDDDAVEPTPALDRLLALSERTRVPVALAVIPAALRPGLAEVVADRRGVIVLQHGWSHANHAPPGAKKAELAGQDPGARLDELARGRDLLAAVFGEAFLPVLVPPWNRIAGELVPALPGLGFCALSTFARDDKASATPGLVQMNTHLDPVAWHEGRGLAAEEELLANLAEAIETRPREPFGILTHHLVHDFWTWRFIGDVLDLLAGHDGAQALDARGALAAAAGEDVLAD